METIQSIKQRFEIIGNDPKLNRAIEKAIQVAPTDISVLVAGESGVGKENIPRIIHSLSHRKHGKYIAVNCGAIPEGTIDSELFGHEKGAFTGATSTREGYFEVADGGTIFLDEIGDMSLSAQAKVLRALQESLVQRVGADKDIKINVRVVAATNKDLKKEIAEGRFREDLYHRLAVILIKVPSLNDRRSDIPLLIEHFAIKIAEEQGNSTKVFSKKAITLLQEYDWTGNIRELRNVVERLIILGGNEISETDVKLFASK
jgi:transcriptional regulator with GAF, ATPase, and Fis domain